MNSQNNKGDVVSLEQIAKHINTENLNMDIVVFDHAMAVDDKKVFPLRVDALVIALCTEGSGKIGIDLREYEIRKNTMIVIQPKNYVYLSDYSDDFRCSAVACSNRVVEDVLPKLTDVLPLLLHHRTEPVTDLHEDEAKGISHFYTFLRKKLHEPPTPFLRQKVICMLQAALYEMMDINLRNASDIEPQRSRKEEIMAKFLLAVSENFRQERQVAYYAQKLCITPKHLSSVVKEISGRTAGDWIENYVIMEAKVLLKTTDMTIQEIALYLNFANQSFFGKYFKHHTKDSPTTYRKKHS
jgi:AraC-like DNA-binding protein